MSEGLHIENFEIGDMLGRGGMATVWKARQASLDRFVAIKVLSSSFATDPADVDRFREEARAAGRLKHPGIVQVYDANFTNGNYYFVMELVDGYTVGEWIRRKARLEVSDALTVAESVIAALDYAWTSFGIIHCDIKPENIMVDADGSVKTTDLGLARAIVSMQTREQEQEVLGTPAYMSPEQVAGQPDLDCRADIYALGATLYHMVTGHPLFAGEGTDDEIMQKQLIATVPSPSREVPGLSRGFVLLLAKMLAKDRKYRPQDWKDVMADIRRVRERRTPAGVEPPPGSSTIFIDSDESDTVRRRARKSSAAGAPPATGGHGARTACLILGTVLLLAAVGAVWFFLPGGALQGGGSAAVPPAKLSDEDRYKAALAYAADNPNDWTGGLARLDVVLSQAPGSWYAQQARVQRDGIREKLDAAIQATCRKLDEQTSELVAHNHVDAALRLLENYQGAYAAATAAWRLEQAQMLRGQSPATRPPDPAPAPSPPPAPHVDPAPAPVAAPAPAPRPVVISQKDGVARIGRVLLRKGVDAANRQVTAQIAAHKEWAKGGAVATLQDLLSQAHAAEDAALQTFAADHGKEITVALPQGPVKGTVGEISNDHVRLTLAGGIDRSLALDELDTDERLKRLGRTGDNGAGAALLKGVWAYHAHATERAKALFSALPEPIGDAMSRAVDENP